VWTGGGPLRLRSGPSTSSTRAGYAPDGSTLRIACQVSGDTITGPAGTTAQWDRLTSGLYVAHAYVRSDPVPACPTASPLPAPARPQKPGGTSTGTVASRDGSVRIRAGASTASAIVGHVDNGATVTISCAVNGQAITGTVGRTTQWDRLADGTYISHAYVRSGAVPACTGGSTAVTGEPSGSMSQQQFIAASVAPAQQAYREYGVPASITIAQAILESGWGRSRLSAQDRNYFGIKCWDSRYGSIAIGCHSYSTVECSSSGCGLTTASFRVYASVAGSFRDHAVFLTTNRRYRPAFSHTRDADRFIEQVALAGYATDPRYADKVKAVMARYQLYQYDRL
jgi:flagellar protein FlgJ